MRKLLLALALVLVPTLADAQCTGVFPANTLCGNLSGTAQPPRAFSAGGTVIGPGVSLLNGLATWGNTSGTLLQNGSTIPGNYTWLSASQFNGPVGISGTFNSSGTFQIGGATKTFPAGAVTLGGLSTTQTWTGTNNFTGPVNLSATTVVSGTSFFGGSARFGGQPWFDVKAGVHGCAPAAGDAATDDTGAIQCVLNYVSSTTNGGLVFFPPGTYRITSTLTVGPVTNLIGSGINITLLHSQALDINTLHFTGSYSGLSNMFVTGSTSAAATQPIVLIDANLVQNTFRDCNIWGGKWAVQVKAVDFLFDNCFIFGFGSTGGNAYINGGAGWFNRAKFDDDGRSHQYAVLIDAGTSVGAQENAFVNSDFSGNFTVGSVIISNTNAYTQFTNITASNPFLLNKHTWTGFANAKFASYISTAANLTTIVSSKGLTAITATNASCAANFGITC